MWYVDVESYGSTYAGINYGENRLEINLRKLFDITKHGMKEHREEIIIV